MFWYTFALIAILSAVAISLVRIFITDVKEYRQEAENFASTVLEQDVKIDSMEAKMSGFSPLVVFNGVQMLTDGGARELVRFEQARLTIDPIRSLLHFRIVPKALTVSGVVIGVRRKSDGTLSIQGLTVDQLGEQFAKHPEAASQDNELADWLFRRSELAIQNSTVVWLDETQNNQIIQFRNVNFFLRNDEDRHQLNGAVSLPEEYGDSLEIAFDFNGNLLDPRDWYGQFHAQGKGLNIKSWGLKLDVVDAEFQSGFGDLSVWGESSGGQIRNMAADFSIDEFRGVMGHTDQVVEIKRLAGLFDWQRLQDGWVLQVDKLDFEGKTGAWPQTRLMLDYRPGDKGQGRVAAYASYLRLQDVREILTHSQIITDDIKQRLVELQPQGQLSDVVLRTTLTKDEPKYQLSAKLDHLSIEPYENFPGITNFSGELAANEQRGNITLTGQDSQIFAKKLFRAPFDISSLQAEVNWWHANQQWYIQSRDVTFSGQDVSGDLSVLCILDDKLGSPYLDIQASYKDGNAQSVYKYLPVTIMAPELVHWLDNAFKSGRVNRGGFVFNGRLANFPFRHFDGNMLADFYTEDVVLNYLPGWPTLLTRDVHMKITGHGLEGSSLAGEMFSSNMQHAKVSLPDFRLPVLDVSGTFNGPASDMAQFLVQSPIAKGAGEFVEQSKISGDISGSLELHIPLSKKATKASPLDYVVKTSVHDSRVDLWNNKLVLEHINGEVSYRPKKLRSRNLKANILDQPVSLRLYSQADDKSEEILLDAKGKLDAKKLRDHIQSRMLEQVSGVTDWGAVLSLGRWYDNGRYVPGYFHFSSQLNGIECSLPPPLNKQADENKLLKVQLRLPEKGTLPVYVRLGTDWTAALAVNLDEQAPGLIKKGKVVFLDETAQLPKDSELVIRGWIQQLPVTQWTHLFEQEQKLHGGAASARPILDPAVPVHFDLDYLQIVTEEDDTRQPASDPRKTPLLNGQIRKLVYNKINFGQVNFRSERHVDGITYDNFSIDGPLLNASGKGSWYYRDGGQLTNILIEAKSNDVGALLGELGYSAVLRNGQLQSVIQANWNDTPANFDIAHLSASVGMVISNGIISDVKPGAGKLLGLLSLSELPRRLQLDFSEFRSGLNFNQIVGQLEINDGISRIDSLRVLSPVALMKIEGSTNLVEKTFDQTLRIVPNISGTAPIVSWLALGGQVGALVFVLDQLFGDAFDESVGTDYRVIGTWEHPQIERIGPIHPPSSSSDLGD